MFTKYPFLVTFTISKARITKLFIPRFSKTLFPVKTRAEKYRPRLNIITITQNTGFIFQTILNPKLRFSAKVIVFVIFYRIIFYTYESNHFIRFYYILDFLILKICLRHDTYIFFSFLTYIRRFYKKNFMKTFGEWNK